MTIAKVTEITAASKVSFDDAVRQGLARAHQTLDNISGAWIKDQEVLVQNGEVCEYRVHMKVTFVLK
jgi:flavin-binding protein dodecin